MSSASQKSEGRAFADNIRQPEEMKNALVWLFDTDASQLAGFLRSGPAAGRAQLLLACSKAVCEPPNPAPASSDSPPVAPTSKGAATISPASAASDVNAAPAASADAASATKEPQHDGTGAGAPAASAAAAASSGDTKDVKEPTSDASATSVAKGAVKPGNVEAPIASADGGTDAAATPGPSPPPGAPTPAENTSDPVGPSAPDGASRFDHVAPPAFLDTSEIPRKAKVSTRQVLCCRETCSICFQACCGYVVTAANCLGIPTLRPRVCITDAKPAIVHRVPARRLMHLHLRRLRMMHPRTPTTLGIIHHRTLLAHGSIPLGGAQAKVAGSGTLGTANGCGISCIFLGASWWAALHLLSTSLRLAAYKPTYLHCFVGSGLAASPLAFL